MWNKEERRMIQLKPHLKAPLYHRSPYSFLQTKGFLLSLGAPTSMTRGNRFPFREALPLYLKSQARFTKPSRHPFLLHNTNKALNRYYKSGTTRSPTFKRKNMEALMLKGLRDLITSYEGRDELVSLQEYWAYKVSDYLIDHIISQKSLQFPRLKEFLKKRNYGDPKRFSYYKKMIGNWKNPKVKDPDVTSWLKREYKPALDFIKRSIQDINVFIEMNMGNRRYKNRRLSNLRKSSALMNFVYDLLGTELSPELRLKMEKNQKVFQSKKKNYKKVISFVVKDYSRFNENRALTGICKKHFKTIYCAPITPLKQQKFIPNIPVFRKMKSSELMSESQRNIAQIRGMKIYKPEIVPYAKIEYEKRINSFSSKKLVFAHLKFLEDLQNVFGTSAEEIASRKPLEDILWGVKNTSDENVVPMDTVSISSDGGKANIDPRYSMDDDDIKETIITKPKSGNIKKSVNTGTVKWKKETVKKACYIILRILKNMATMKLLTTSDVKSEAESPSETSVISEPDSVKAQLTPFIALRSLLSEGMSSKLILPTLRHLKNNAKGLYKKIEEKERALVLDKFKEYNKIYSRSSGMASEDRDIPKMLSEWDKEIENGLNEGFTSTDSENSIAYDVQRPIFNYRGLNVSNKRTGHIEVVCLLILFLSVSDKILSVRRAANEFVDQKKTVKSEHPGEMKVKKKKKKDIRLSEFKEFLKKNNAASDVEAYISVAERYCPDYLFYEHKSEVKRKQAERVASEEEILETVAPSSPSPVEGGDDEGEGGSPTTPQSVEEGRPSTPPQSQERQYAPPKSVQLSEDKSYLSCSKEGRKKGRKESGICLLKHTKDWDEVGEAGQEPGVSRAYLTTDFFEYPTTLEAIPKLVTDYTKEVVPPRIRQTYILDPLCSSLKWDKADWTRDEYKLAPYERLDDDLPWMRRYFTTFWMSEGEQDLPWEEIQRLIFASWCGGDLHVLYDMSWKYFDAFSLAVEEFEKLHGKTRRIYDVSDVKPTMRKNWIKVKDYLENQTTIGAMGLKEWQKRLSRLYKDVENCGSEVSYTSQMSSQASINRIRASLSVMDMSANRSAEKFEMPTGFALRDSKSLQEALDNFLEKTRHFQLQRVCLFGMNYKPLTEYYLKRISEECGFVYTHEDPSLHPNARKAPPRAIFYNDKEKLFYRHSNNFIDIFQKKYPGRFLKMPFHVKNEYGSMKHVCTFICPRRLSWPKMDTWKGCMCSVCNKLQCLPLEDPYRPPDRMKSPYTTLLERKGNVFELSTLLTGLLLGAGYEAYCVCGTATYHRSYYANTDDVSPDGSDLEPPPTNRYKQYNLLAPFTSAWLRNRMKEPIPYEELEICKVKRNEKSAAMEVRRSWPTTEKGLIAFYSKEVKKKVEERSRFDNPSIPLYNRVEEEKEARKVVKGGSKAVFLGHLYDQLILELRKRTTQEKLGRLSEIATKKNYTHEDFVPIKSTYETIRMKKQKEDREERRKLVKSKKEEITEEDEYFDWLYGPKGTHKDYYEMLQKEGVRARRDKPESSVQLLEFLEKYDPTIDRLETPAGEERRDILLRKYRCKKRLKKKTKAIQAIDWYKLSKFRIKKYQEKMIRANKVPRDKDPYGFEELDTDVQTMNIAKTRELDMKAHKYKIRQSPFIGKMLVKIEETFPNKVLFDKIIDRLGFHVGDLELPAKEVPMNLEGVDMEVYEKHVEERVRRRRIQKTRARRTHENYLPSRIHCWVLVKAGSREVKESFFIDVLTGCRYPTSDKNYLKISCVWNHNNYYIPRFVPTLHPPTREFSLTDLELWFHLLPMEPDPVERKKKPWWWDAKGHPHQLQHTRVPPYWGRRVRIPHTEWDKKFATSNKKTFNYKKTIIEAYDPAGRPTDGLLKRITKFFDMRKSVLREVSTRFSLRKDRLIWRCVDINSGFVEEKFEEGRPDNLKIFRYLAYLLPGMYTPKEFQFYGKWRQDRLQSLLITKRYLLAEFREGREDHLKRVKLYYSLRKSERRFMVLDEHSSCIKRVRARYWELSPNYSVWKDMLGDVPRKVDINMAGGYSEYWYWDEALGTQVKWSVGHANSEDIDVLLRSPDLQDNPLLIREPLLYGVTVSLEDSPRELALRKDRYAKREEKDRLYLMSVAKQLEQIVSDTVILREYEKIKDVLRTTDEMKKNNLTTEKALISMKKYFEVEREILVKDYNKTRQKGSIWDIWTCDENLLTGKLLNYFIREQFWLYFVIGGWDDMNRMFKTIVKERQDSIPVFSGYTDLLRTLLDAFNQGFRLTESRVPTGPKRDLDMWPLQINVPIGVGVQRLRQLSADLGETIGCTTKDGGRKNDHRGVHRAEERSGDDLSDLTNENETIPSESEEQVDLGRNIASIQHECFLNYYPETLDYSNLSSLKDVSDQETESSETLTKSITNGARCLDVSNDFQLVKFTTDGAMRNKVLSERNRSRQKFNLSKINNRGNRNIEPIVYSRANLHSKPSFSKLGSNPTDDGKGTKPAKRESPKRNLYIKKYKPLNGISYVEGNATETCRNIKSKKQVITKSKTNVINYNEFNDNINTNINEYLSSSVLPVTNKDSKLLVVKDGTKIESELFKEKPGRRIHKDPNCKPSEHYLMIDDNENPSLKKLFLQITKILTPNQMKEFLKSGKKNIKHTWNEQFVNFYNTFIDDITTARTSNFPNDNEEVITELIDYKHPFGYQIDKLDKEFGNFKNRPLEERLSVEELGTLLDTFSTKRKKEPIKEETRRKVTDIVNRIKKRFTLMSYSKTRATQHLIDSIIGPESSDIKSTAGTKKKKKSQSVKFTFECSPETGGNSEDDKIDCYNLFSQKYNTDLKNIDNLRQFVEELENKPTSSLVVNKITNLDNEDHMNVSFKLQKGEYFADSGSEKAFQFSQDSNQVNVNEESGYPFMRKIVTKLDSPTLEVKNYIDLGVVEVINLFSKPSELEFIEIGDPKFVKLQPILKETDIKIYDSETSVCLRRMFPIDYSTLELYEEFVPNDGILDFEGGKEKCVKESTNGRSLKKSIDSCPHCVNVYYQANKDRLFILRMVEFLRDENMAKTRARIDGAAQAEEILKSYQRAIQVFGEYVKLLKDSSSVTSSYRNKMACDECRRFRYFLEILNYRTLLDYRIPPRPEEPWRRLSHLDVPIPFYHSKRPSVGRLSLTSQLEVAPAHLIPSLTSLERVVEEEKEEEPLELYPDVDETDAIRAELYRDLRPKTRKIHKPLESTTSFVGKTARTEVIRKVVKKF